MSDEARRYLVRRPKPLQWFHHQDGGVVLRKTSDDERSSARFELFLDLLYVALVANFADDFTEEPTGVGLVKYILIFTPAWIAWSCAKELANAYFNDDLYQRVAILWIMALLVLYGNNAILVEDIDALRTTVAVYMVLRFSQISSYALYSFASPYHRHQTRIYAALQTVGLVLYTPLYFDEISVRAKVAVTVVAIVYEVVAWTFSFGPWLKTLLNLKYSTALDIPHEVDRATAFYVIVLGEFLYYVIVKSPAAIGLNLRALRAVWTLVIAFSLNWLYSNGDGSLKVTHPLRRSVWTAFGWLMSQLPLSAGLLIGGHICAVSVSEDELIPANRWLWGGGLGVGMLVLFCMAFLEKSEDAPGALLFPKYLRMAPRLVVAIIFALLPLASEEDLSPTALISIGAGIMLFVVIWETVGSLERGACMFESWKHRDEDELEAEQTNGDLSASSKGE